MIGERLNSAINDQIRNELESYYIYLSMAAYFHSNSLDGMGHWMRAQAHEEMIHATKFMEHLIDRDGKVVLQDLKQLKTEWSSPLEAFQDALEHERFISGKINDLTTIAREEKDYGCRWRPSICHNPIRPPGRRSLPGSGSGKNPPRQGFRRPG